MGKLGKVLLESLICFQESYSGLRGMQKFSAAPRLAAYSFENFFLKAVQLRMSAHSTLETLGEIF